MHKNDELKDYIFQYLKRRDIPNYVGDALETCLRTIQKRERSLSFGALTNRTRNNLIRRWRSGEDVSFPPRFYVYESSRKMEQGRVIVGWEVLAEVTGMAESSLRVTINHKKPRYFSRRRKVHVILLNRGGRDQPERMDQTTNGLRVKECYVRSNCPVHCREGRAGCLDCIDLSKYVEIPHHKRSY